MSLPDTAKDAVLPGNVAPLWDVDQCGRFLGRSRSWIWQELKRDPKTGGIPHVRIKTAPRFVPNDVVEWVKAGCPPVAQFETLKALEAKKHR